AAKLHQMHSKLVAAQQELHSMGDAVASAQAEAARQAEEVKQAQAQSAAATAQLQADLAAAQRELQALQAALAVSEASIYGRGIDIRAARFFERTRQALARGESLGDCVQKEIKAQRGLAGYGRPIAAGDERIEPIMRLAKSLGLSEGPNVRMAFDVEAFLLAGRWRWRMNYAALTAALTADLGLSPEEHYRYGFPAFLAGMQPGFIEACEQPAGAVFPVLCSQINYIGHAPRAWPGGANQARPTSV
ncbi:MAG: hypothetical protein ACKOF9_10780, partial [Burkholderiales bacterium]